LTILENHSVLQRLDGRFSQASCTFSILPTILTVVSGEKLDSVVSALRKEEEVEETDENSID